MWNSGRKTAEDDRKDAAYFKPGTDRAVCRRTIRRQGKIYASELPMETMDDFIRLIYVRLYGSRKRCDIGLKRQKVRIKSVESLISRILRS